MNKLARFVLLFSTFIALVVSLVLSSLSQPLFAWQSTGGGRLGTTTTVVAVDAGSTDSVCPQGVVLSVSPAEATLNNGLCPGNGAIYFCASQPEAKFFYAAALTARATNRNVYLQIDCGPGNRARLIEIEVNP